MGDGRDVSYWVYKIWELLTGGDPNVTTISVTATPGAGAATSANQTAEQTLLGAVNETAPATDTASSGLNGRLQRIAQRITSLIALVPTALSALGGFKVQELAAPVYEDNTLGKAVVEHRYSYGRVTADGQIKASAGFIHTISIAPLTATPTAGLLTIYDNTAESGTIIYSEWIFATTPGHTIILDVSCATGIYVGFDATLANVQVTVSYR